MKKFEIAPCVMVYKNFFKEPERMLNEVIRAEENHTKYINPSFDYLYSMHRSGLKVDGFGEAEKLKRSNQWHRFTQKGKKSEMFLQAVNNDKDHVNHDIYQKVLDSFKYVFQDFLDDHKNCNFWMPYINSFDLNDKKWHYQNVNILNHYGFPDNPKDTLVMGYHLDSVDANIEPGAKHAVTANIYLNDNYENGEINFLYAKNLSSIETKTAEIVSYKPEAGDVVVYPSVWPVAHGVNFPVGANRYLLNSILVWTYDGSMGEDLRKYLIEDKTVYNDIANLVSKEDIVKIDGKNLNDK